MVIVNETPLAVAPFVTMGGPGRCRLTLILKGTYALSPGTVAVPAPEPLLPTGDEPYPDDEDGTGSLRYASDFVPRKPKADLLLVGTCHAPGGTSATSCRVTFGVGGRKKTLRVTGDRTWRSVGGVAFGVTEPEPFTSMPLRYERAFGGKGFASNPLGRGFDETSDDGDGRRALPNLEDPGRIVVSASDRPDPAGFGPLPLTWPQRLSKAGTYDDAWLKQRWPGFPVDFDEGFFNAAPADLQAESLAGDEELFFEHLHPAHAEYRCRLPGVRPRCFVRRRPPGAAPEPDLFEVPLSLDTLWVDVDAELLVLVWRGAQEVRSPRLEEVDQVYVAVEERDAPPASLEVHRAELDRLLSESEIAEEEAPAFDAEAAVAKAQLELRQALEAAGVSLDEPGEPPPPTAEDRELFAALGLPLPTPPRTREEVAALASSGHNFAAEDLRGLDLSGLLLAGRDFTAAQLAGARLVGTCLTGATLEGAALGEADLGGADLRGARLADADLARTRLEGADLTGACLDRALVEEANLRGAVLDGASALEADFTGADLTGASALRATLKGADLSGARLDRANFQGANLEGASLEGAQGEGVDLTLANIAELRAAGARLPNARAGQASGSSSIWTDAVLSNGHLPFAQLDGADFSGCRLDTATLDAASLRGARFSGGTVRGAQLRRANLFEASFEEADLTDADLAGSNLFGAEFLGAVLDGTRFHGANLKRTKLQA
ncbi:MAG: DUF2169 domain-containing protein [Deltaproteobacteria bacterium]|nr:DUF2169 domain-containing protein [Deltaproteobacteria bacterium]